MSVVVDDSCDRDTTIARVLRCLSYGSGGYAVALNALDDAKEA